MCEDKSVIGPLLPPGFKLKANSDSEDDSEDSSSAYVPTDASKSLSLSVPDEEPDLYGPALPPNFQQHSEPKVLGPALPADFAGVSVSDDESGDSHDAVVGPSPNLGDDIALSRIQQDFEKRAERMKKKLTGVVEEQKLQREEWMTSLPPEMGKAFGLGPRAFSQKKPIPTGDRSVWTDTPEDTLRKAQKKAETPDTEAETSLPQSVACARDAQIEAKVDEYNKSKRTQSLMDIHQKKLKRKMAEEAGKPKERRPFDRDVDLKANYFDNAQKEAIIKRSRQLNDKFKAGNMKFL